MSREGKREKKRLEQIARRESNPKRQKNDGIRNSKEIGNKDLTNYKGLLEELHQKNISISGFPDFHDLAKGKIPTREDYQNLKILYYQEIVKN
jgi:hypothetical protein